MQNFKCHVTGSTSAKKLGKAKPPVYCADDASKCVKGPKQMIVWHRTSTPRPALVNFSLSAFLPPCLLPTSLFTFPAHNFPPSFSLPFYLPSLPHPSLYLELPKPPRLTNTRSLSTEAEGNNVFPPNDVTPPYNTKMGFLPGAQNDIFEDPASPPPAASVRLGCYTDTSSPRVLPSSVQIPEGNANLTPARCISACKNSGHTYAGVEYMTECWCGNSAPASGLKIADSECDLPCAGDSSLTCGAAWKLEAWKVTA